LSTKRRLTEVLAENHGVVAASLVFEDRVAMVRVAETAGDIELTLDAAEIAGVAAVFARTGHHAKEIVRHVLDRIETETIGLGAVDFPTGRADKIGADVFDVSDAILHDVGLGVRTELLGRGRSPQGGTRAIDQPSEIDAVAVLVVVVLLGAVDIADE
jgi:hypothetical protein